MFGEVVEGIDGHRFESALAALKHERGVQHDTRSLGRRPARARRDVQGRSIARRPASEFPQDAREQLLRAVRAVFESWDTPRAQVYRRAHDIPDDLGTAVNVVQMVFGNKGDRSGTGVAFTRDPSTGETRARTASSSRTPRARTSSPASARRSRSRRCATSLPEAFDQLVETMRPARGALPRHAGHRVHGRGRAAVSAADALGEAHRGGRAEGGGGDGRRGADHARGGGRRASTRRSSTSSCTR